MKIKVSGFIGKMVNRENIKIDQRLFIFLFFLLISTIFWFLNALSKDYTTEIQFPVEYSGLPEDKFLIVNKELPEHLKLKIKAYGFTLLRYEMNIQAMPIEVNLSDYQLNQLPGDDTSAYFLPTSLLENSVNEQLSSGISVTGISPDTIIFRFNDIVEKRIPVHPDIEYSLQKQYMLKGEIAIYPDSITVSGPAEYVEKISRIKTMPYHFTDINSSVSKMLPLLNVRNLTFAPNEVNVVIPVEEYTEQKIQVPLELRNVPDSLVLKPFPNRVNIAFLVGLSDYNRVSSDDFKVVIDYNEIAYNIGDKLKVHIMRSPTFIKSLQISPKHVEYIIEKR